MEMPDYLYTCHYCGIKYKPNRRNKQLYCSNSCRVNAFNIRNKKNKKSSLDKILDAITVDPEIISRLINEINPNFKADEVITDIQEKLKNSRLNDVQLSTRALFILKRYISNTNPPDTCYVDDMKVKDLAYVNRSKFSKYRNVGPGTIAEVDKLCSKAGVEMLK